MVEIFVPNDENLSTTNNVEKTIVIIKNSFKIFRILSARGL